MSIQILPLKQIAAWLSSNPVTLEIADSLDPLNVKSGTDEAHPPFVFYGHSAGPALSLFSTAARRHADEALFVRDADDILYPPPNS